MKKIIILLSLSLSFCAVAEDRQWVSCIEVQTEKCKAVRARDIRETDNVGKYIALRGYDFFSLPLIRCKPDTLQYGLFCDEHSAETVDTAEDKAKDSKETEYEGSTETESDNHNEGSTETESDNHNEGSTETESDNHNEGSTEKENDNHNEGSTETENNNEGSQTK